MTTGAELFQAGRLSEAVEALNAHVRAKPGDVQSRALLAELLCFTGNTQRADTLLDQIGTQDPSLAPTLALFRQLLRADVARGQFHEEGRLPEFLDTPPDWLQLHVKAAIALREGNGAEAAALLAAAEEQRPAVAGTCDGQRFDDLRDMDDLAAGFFEVYTSTGKYYWIPVDRVAEVEFEPPKRPFDLLWRQAHMDVTGGPDGVVYLPVLYPLTSTASEDSVRLGRVTEWMEAEGAPVRGMGQRCFLVGDEGVPMMSVTSLVFDRKE